MKRKLLTVVLFILISTPIFSKTLTTNKINTPPVIDGFISNNEWTVTDSAFGFIQMEPFKGQPAVILAISGGGDHEKTAANIRLVLEYYEYTIIGEFVEGMGEAIVSKEEHPDIYNELFSLGKKLDEAIMEQGG